MAHYDFFNGDADGLCALHQLRLANPIDSVLVSGVKRDIALVKQAAVEQVTSATILDLSFDKNRAAVIDLLDAGVAVQYFDHHFAGEIPDNKNLDAHINTHAETCTGLLVNQHLQNAHLPNVYLPWAVTAAFGDNLHSSAVNAARPLGLTDAQLAQLEELGTLLNYNGYGANLDDLFFDPKVLYQKIKPYVAPLDFIENDTAYKTLRDGYTSDRQLAGDLTSLKQSDRGCLVVLPEAKWARRISGVFGNELARKFPDRAHALLSTLPGGSYSISVRAPLNRREGADDLCRQFATGGGRKAAAGINLLAADQLDHFIDLFYQQFG